MKVKFAKGEFGSFESRKPRKQREEPLTEGQAARLSSLLATVTKPAAKPAGGKGRLVQLDHTKPDPSKLQAYAAKLGFKKPNAQQLGVLQRFAFTLMPQGQVREMLQAVAD